MRSAGEGGEGRPRAPTGVDEDIEGVEEGEKDSISNVRMDAGQGTFIAGTGDPTVAAVRAASKKTYAVMVKEDMLHKRISEYGLVSPARAQNPVWCFFKKYGCKKRLDHLGDDTLQLSTQAICMLCHQHEDKRRVQHATVKLGKDNSPSSLMDHLRIHHLQEYNSVAVALSKKYPWRLSVRSSDCLVCA